MLQVLLSLLLLCQACAGLLHCHIRDKHAQRPQHSPACRLQAFQWPFILYGDSLTEMWKGTQACQPAAARKGFDALRQKYLSPLSNADGMSGARRWLVLRFMSGSTRDSRSVQDLHTVMLFYAVASPRQPHL